MQAFAIPILFAAIASVIAIGCIVTLRWSDDLPFKRSPGKRPRPQRPSARRRIVRR